MNVVTNAHEYSFTFRVGGFTSVRTSPGGTGAVHGKSIA